jgi:hypothetical protein
LSILITDSQINATNTNVQSCERSARYDGIITFGENLTVVIENKPRSENVWFGQLNPSRQNLNEDTIVYSAPIILQWKEIIKQLTYLLNAPTISGYEKILIEDFLSYIDESFPFLNPYDSFDQCKRNPELLRRRINNLLKEIALDESQVGYHRSGSYYIQTTYNQIERICLGLGQIEDEWFIGLALFFGDTQRQAISFYGSNPKIGCLNNAKWKVSPNFHVSFRTQNLISFESKESEKYLQFWKDNVEEIHQQKRGDVPKYFKWLVDSKVITMPKESEERLNQKFYKTKMPSLNICPGFALNFDFKISEAEELDKSGKLKFILVEKIKEGLKIVGLDGQGVLKPF